MWKKQECGDLHERIVDGDNKDLSSSLELVTVHVAGNVGVGASGRESGGNTNDDTLGRGELVGEIDLVAGRVLEEVDIGDGITLLNLSINSRGRVNAVNWVCGRSLDIQTNDVAYHDCGCRMKRPRARDGIDNARGGRLCGAERVCSSKKTTRREKHGEEE